MTKIRLGEKEHTKKEQILSYLHSHKVTLKSTLRDKFGVTDQFIDKVMAAPLDAGHFIKRKRGRSVQYVRNESVINQYLKKVPQRLRKEIKQERGVAYFNFSHSIDRATNIFLWLAVNTIKNKPFRFTRTSIAKHMRVSQAYVQKLIKDYPNLFKRIEQKGRQVFYEFQLKKFWTDYWHPARKHLESKQGKELMQLIKKYQPKFLS